MGARKAPEGLGAKARAFWTETTKVYDLSAHEALMLEGACREIDLIDRLEDELDGAALVSRGSMGQDVAHPLLGEVRQHRAAFGSIMKQLRLPELEDEAPMSPRSMQAQAAANARWSRGA
ncbi:hypothetical protein [Agromyces aureus]|uniref:Terminase n=1 Tax=Agromyces aureus TaxID=453304 RepID=A0A191WF54_9MICO|nr:hypothetical protein [Agromyces aureus]ANJ26809.1 hypothetical protein ATC03_08855 [Agromyces aureus]